MTNIESSLDRRWLKEIWISRRLEVMPAKSAPEIHWAVPVRVRALSAPVNFCSSMRFNSINACSALRPRWTTRDVNIDGNVAVDSFENIVALQMALEIAQALITYFGSAI